MVKYIKPKLNLQLAYVSLFVSIAILENVMRHFSILKDNKNGVEILNNEF